MRAFWIVAGCVAATLGMFAAVPIISQGSLSAPFPLAVLLALPLGGVICARLGLQVSARAAVALATGTYLASVPAVALLERWQHPQDLSVLVIALVVAGLALVPLGAMGLKVLNAAARPVARSPRSRPNVR